MALRKAAEEAEIDGYVLVRVHRSGWTSVSVMSFFNQTESGAWFASASDRYSMESNSVGHGQAGQYVVPGSAPNNSAKDHVSNANNVAGFLLSPTQKYFVDSEGFWRGKNGKTYRPGWGGNGATGARANALMISNSLKVVGKVSLAGSVVLTANDVISGEKSPTKGAVDVFMAGVSVVWPIGTFASIAYFSVDYANDGDWTGSDY